MKKILSICMAVLIVTAMLAMTAINASATQNENFAPPIPLDRGYVDYETDVLAPIADDKNVDDDDVFNPNGNVDDDDTFNPDGNSNVDGDKIVDDDTTGNTSGNIVDDTTGNTDGNTKPVGTTDDKGETVTTATEAVTENATEAPAVPEKKSPVKTENPKTGNDMPVVAMLMGIALFCTASVMIRKRLTSK